MTRIAIVGTGPTGVYSLAALLEESQPQEIDIFEASETAGVGMPFKSEINSRLMLANIASIEIPPVRCTYLDWLENQATDRLSAYGMDRYMLSERQFLPRTLLGEYYRDQFLDLVAQARARGIRVNLYEACRVLDVICREDGVWLATQQPVAAAPYDFVILATGHVWPSSREATRSYFPSPWSGLIEAHIPACRVGIRGTSLSGIDAAMAVVSQHGDFSESGNGDLVFELEEGAENLSIVLMSRSGILPEADFYCPIPYEPLVYVDARVIETEIAVGKDGLLDRVFALMIKELQISDALWCDRIGADKLDADSFAPAYFSDRMKYDPFRWAEYNLREVEENRRLQHTVAWRYTLLRLHERVQDIVEHLTDEDRARFDRGLKRVFVDNYAAVPPETIRRILALRNAGVIDILELGEDYKLETDGERTSVKVRGETLQFDVFIDARGQKLLETKDLPFPTLRRELEELGLEIPEIADDYTLTSPPYAEGRIAFLAIPYLMHDQPFIQGITACAEIARAAVEGCRRERTQARQKRSYALSL